MDIRPERQAPPEVFYNAEEAQRYTEASHDIQVELTRRSLEMAGLLSPRRAARPPPSPHAQLMHDSGGSSSAASSAPNRAAGTPKQCASYTPRPALVLDVGCGSGLSGQVCDQEGIHWVGVDISPNMLNLAAGAHARRATNHGVGLVLSDMGQGLPFGGPSVRAEFGACVAQPRFDAAISISAVQWLLFRPDWWAASLTFFQSLKRVLVPGAPAVLQIYCQREHEMIKLMHAAMAAGFKPGRATSFSAPAAIPAPAIPAASVPTSASAAITIPPPTANSVSTTTPASTTTGTSTTNPTLTTTATPTTTPTPVTAITWDNNHIQIGAQDPGDGGCCHVIMDFPHGNGSRKYALVLRRPYHDHPDGDPYQDHPQEAARGVEGAGGLHTHGTPRGTEEVGAVQGSQGHHHSHAALAGMEGGGVIQEIGGQPGHAVPCMPLHGHAAPCSQHGHVDPCMPLHSIHQQSAPDCPLAWHVGGSCLVWWMRQLRQQQHHHHQQQGQHQQQHRQQQQQQRGQVLPGPATHRGGSDGTVTAGKLPAGVGATGNLPPEVPEAHCLKQHQVHARKLARMLERAAVLAPVAPGLLSPCAAGDFRSIARTQAPPATIRRQQGRKRGSAAAPRATPLASAAPASAGPIHPPPPPSTAPLITNPLDLQLPLCAAPQTASSLHPSPPPPAVGLSSAPVPTAGMQDSGTSRGPPTGPVQATDPLHPNQETTDELQHLPAPLREWRHRHCHCGSTTHATGAGVRISAFVDDGGRLLPCGGHTHVVVVAGTSHFSGGHTGGSTAVAAGRLVARVCGVAESRVHSVKVEPLDPSLEDGVKAHPLPGGGAADQGGSSSKRLHTGQLQGDRGDTTRGPVPDATGTGTPPTTTSLHQQPTQPTPPTTTSLHQQPTQPTPPTTTSLHQQPTQTTPPTTSSHQHATQPAPPTPAPPPLTPGGDQKRNKAKPARESLADVYLGARLSYHSTDHVGNHMVFTSTLQAPGVFPPYNILDVCWTEAPPCSPDEPSPPPHEPSPPPQVQALLQHTAGKAAALLHAVAAPTAAHDHDTSSPCGTAPNAVVAAVLEVKDCAVEPGGQCCRLLAAVYDSCSSYNYPDVLAARLQEAAAAEGCTGQEEATALPPQPACGTQAGDGAQPGNEVQAGDGGQPECGAHADDGAQSGGGARPGDGVQAGHGTQAGSRELQGSGKHPGGGVKPAAMLKQTLALAALSRAVNRCLQQ